GLCKRVLELDAEKRGGVLDQAFIAKHTRGFEDFARSMRETKWHDIEAASGLSRRDLEIIAGIYSNAEKTIGIYGMGLTQHVHGFVNLAMFVNLLLMKGHIGRKGGGISPVRG